MTKLIFGCGYLGQRVAAAWNAAGDDVHVVTRSSARAAEFAARDWTAHVADICEPQSLAALPPVHTVLFAVGYDRQSGRSQRAVMVDGLTNVLAHYRRRCERFVAVSSTSVYGQHSGEWVDETSPCEPTQPGGQCCLAAEQLVRSATPMQERNRRSDERPPDSIHRDRQDADGVILRLAGIYGPGRVLARVEALQRGEPIAGNPDAWLNLIHVDDAVAVLRAVEDLWQPGETYLVCDDRPVSRGEYYSALASLTGAPPPQFDAAQSPRRGSGGLNKRCRNRKLHEQLQVTLRYPTLYEGLPASL